MNLTEQERLKIIMGRIGGDTKPIYSKPFWKRGKETFPGFAYEVDDRKLAQFLLELTDKIDDIHTTNTSDSGNERSNQGETCLDS